MGRKLTQKLHLDYIKVSRISVSILHLVLLLLVIIYLCLALWQEWSLLPVWIGIPLLLCSYIIFGYLWPSWKYKSFSFEVFEKELEIKSGIIFVNNVLVPMNRVQHVELGSGPLMRKYELASVTIVTAATRHIISGLKLAEAESLKIQIGELARTDEEHE